MKREILTPSRCREDMKSTYKMNVLAIVIAVAFLQILVMLIAFLPVWGQTDRQQRDLYTVSILGGYALCVVWFVWWYYRRYQKIDWMVLEIVEDQLISYTVREVYRYRKGYRTRVYDIYILIFRYFGEYKIPDRPHYTWSKQYSADRDQDLYDRAEAGDTYYIVLDRDAKRKKPLLIYNTKEFVFCPDGTTRSPDDTWRDSVGSEE